MRDRSTRTRFRPAPPLEADQTYRMLTPVFRRRSEGASPFTHAGHFGGAPN